MKRGRKPVAASGILDAACRVFSQKGYFRATVDDVMRSAGVGKGTVYRHFPDKEGLLVALLSRMAADLNERVSAGLKSSGNLQDRLTWVARDTLDFFSARPALLRIFVREGALTIPLVRKTMGTIVRRNNDRLAEILGGRSMMRAAAVFNGMIFSLLRQRIGINDEPIHPAKDAEFLVGIFLYGFRGRKS